MASLNQLFRRRMNIVNGTPVVVRPQRRRTRRTAPRVVVPLQLPRRTPRNRRNNRRDVTNLRRNLGQIRPRQNQAPRGGYRNKQQSCAAEYRCTYDYWGDLSPGLNVLRFEPGKSDVLWLDAQARLWDLWKLFAARIFFEPNSANNVNGRISLGIDYSRNRAVTSLADVRSLDHYKTCAIYQDTSITVSPSLVMKSKFLSTAVGSKTPDYPSLGFVLYIWVETDSASKACGSIMLDYTIHFSGRDSSDSKPQTTNIVATVPAAPAPGPSAVVQQPIITVDMPDPSNPSPDMSIEAPFANQDSASEPLVTTVEIDNTTNKLQTGDTFSIVSTNNTSQHVALMKKYPHTISSITAPVLNLRYADGTPIPKTVITPYDVPSIDGKSVTSHYGATTLIQGTDLTDAPLSDFFGDAFKVVGDVASNLDVFADLVGAFMFTKSVDSLAEDPLEPLHQSPLIRNAQYSSLPNAVSAETTEPLIVATSMSPEIDATVPAVVPSNLWDISSFGSLTQITYTPSTGLGHITKDTTFTPLQKTPDTQVIANFNSDWTTEISFDSGSGNEQISSIVNTATPLKVGDLITGVLSILISDLTSDNSGDDQIPVTFVCSPDDYDVGGITKLLSATPDLDFESPSYNSAFSPRAINLKTAISATTNPPDNCAASVFRVTSWGETNTKLWLNGQIAPILVELAQKTQTEGGIQGLYSPVQFRVFATMVWSRSVPIHQDSVDIPDPPATGTHISSYIGNRR